MTFLTATMILLWLVVLLYVVFLVHKQKALESALEDLEKQIQNQTEVRK